MSEEQDALGSLSIATSSPVSPDPPSLYPIRQSSASGANWYLSDQDFSNPNEKAHHAPTLLFRENIPVTFGFW